MICQLRGSSLVFRRFLVRGSSWPVARGPGPVARRLEARSSPTARLSSCILAFLYFFLLERRTVTSLMTVQNSSPVEKLRNSKKKKENRFYIAVSLCFSTVPGNWSSWGAWSNCSETCGNGTSTRTRTCDNPAPAYGGEDCVGAGSMTQDCFEKPCPG